ILLFLITSLLFSCNKEDEDFKAVNFAVFLNPTSCLARMSILCVSEDEFTRLKEIFLANQNGPDLDCLPATVVDLEGTVHEGFLRGYSATGADMPCVQKEYDR
ncbi:MAG: hypothetical protein R3356_01185, partial [Eudoraea sp.]|nr:hypothetical protein [Eudoraea sp.]